MKKLLLLLLFVSCAIISNAQIPYWIWAVHSGGGSYEYPNGLWVDTKDSLYLAGRLAGTISFNGGASATGTGADNPFVAKLDSTGTSKWIREINYSGGYDYGWGFCIDKRSNVYTGGTVSSGASMFIMKYDPNGNLLWSITPSGGGVAAMGLITDGADNLYVTGSMQGNVTFGNTTLIYTGSGQNVFLAKLDSNGNFLWAVSSGVANGNSGYDVGRSISIDQYANVYVGGGYGGQMTFGSLPPAPLAASGTSNLFIAEFDSSGNPVNMFTAANAGINNGDCCTLNHIVLDSCRNIYATGYFENTAQFSPFSLASQGGEDIYVVKADNSGNWQWAVDIGSTGDDQPGGITFDRNSDVYVGGYVDNNSAMFGDTLITGGRYFVAKFANSTGARQYVVTAGNNADADGGGVGGITVDYRKYIYVTFNAGNSVPVTFGPNINPITASSNSDIFLAQLDTIPPRYIVPYPLPSYCPGATSALSFSIVGNFRQGNVFTAQLSDSDGNFANATTIGMDSDTIGGTIVITIPDTIKPGSTYLIRIISSNPQTSSYVNGCHAYYQKNVYTDTSYITIGGNLNASVTPADTFTCAGGSVQLNASGGTSYLWSNGDTTSTITVTPQDTTTYYVHVSNGGCTGYDSILVATVPVPQFTLLPLDTAFCEGQSAILYVDNGGSNFVWAPANAIADSSSYITGDSILVTPTVTTTYTVIGNNPGGCATNGTDVVTIIPTPNKPTFTQVVDTLMSSSQNDNQWFRNDTLLVGDTSQNLTITIPGEYWVVVNNEASGCSTSSDSMQIKTGINQISAINDQLSIYPNPFNNNIFIKINSSADIKDWSLQITDVLGRTVFNKLSIDYSNDIDLSNLASGVYFITVINKTGRAVVPVMKQN